MPTIDCIRCHQNQDPPEEIPYPGDLGDEIRSKVCASCWAEWEAMEVMVINELRLNFMDPAAADTLVVHMREFLCLDIDTSKQE
jgi:Fe-S cluster biosynthesis and repair protein YggX